MDLCSIKRCTRNGVPHGFDSIRRFKITVFYDRIFRKEILTPDVPLKYTLLTFGQFRLINL